MRYRWFDYVIVTTIGLFLWTVLAAAIVGSYYLVKWTWSW